jgi:general stress protein 26
VIHVANRFPLPDQEYDMSASTSPGRQNGDATRQERMAKLRELIEHIETAQLVTMDTDGVLRSRPMATQQLGEDGELWFFTNDYTAKVDHVLVHPEVCVTYADPAKNSYVSVSGKAELVRDPAKIRELWRPMLKAWFRTWRCCAWTSSARSTGTPPAASWCSCSA